jgi:shikimate kinase
MPPPQRIHVIGAAGSGKTTVARLLANLHHVPWYELDVIGYEGGAGRKRRLDERLADLRRIVAQPAWVTEGSFLWWTRDLFEAADRILWLDPPWHVAMPRIVTRHVRASLAGNNRHPGLRKLLRFLWFCRTYYLARQPTVPTDPNQDGPVTRVTVEQFLQPYQEKVLSCHHLAAVNLYQLSQEN